MKIDSINEEITNTKKTVTNANELYQRYKLQTNERSLQVGGGLLSFIQSFSRSLKLENNITSLRPNPTSTGNEGVSVRIEELTLYDIVEILTKLEKYSNLKIEVFNLAKRFDNPKKVDIYLEITKI
ncbi:MAG: hypothetical protein SVN78_01305 [Deferribacterota bacterium]|nr:hypothetical protein [Deferribacterota bacterium]